MRIALAMGCMALAALSAGHAGAGCAATLARDASTAELVACLREQEAELAALGAAPAVPAGAVVAFDRPDGCPPGWSNFRPGAGRFILGVGGRYQLPYADGEPRYQTGGAAAHRLLPSELPAHAHETEIGTDFGFALFGTGASRPNAIVTRRRGGRSLSLTSETGGNAAHNNMPPFVALYYCKKDGG